jgi:hypothetical protein
MITNKLTWQMVSQDYNFNTLVLNTKYSVSIFTIERVLNCNLVAVYNYIGI